MSGIFGNVGDESIKGRGEVCLHVGKDSEQVVFTHIGGCGAGILLEVTLVGPIIVADGCEAWITSQVDCWLGT